MSPEELDARLAGGATLAVDTNVLFSVRELGTLTDLVRAANRSRSQQAPVRLVVPALVHAEILHDLRCFLARKGEPYSAAEVAASLASKGTTVVAFSPEDADGTSAHLFASAPTSTGWRAAKRRNAISHLGMLHREGEVPGKNVPATVDWFIAGHARERGWILITGDRGPEFHGLERVRLADIKAALERLAAHPPLVPSAPPHPRGGQPAGG